MGELRRPGAGSRGTVGDATLVILMRVIRSTLKETALKLLKSFVFDWMRMTKE